MDTHVQDVAPGVYQFYSLLRAPVHVYLLQAPETSYPMIDMRDVIPHFQFGKLGKRQRLCLGKMPGRGKALVTLEYLVIGITGQTGRRIGEPFVQIAFDRIENDRPVHVGEYIFQAAGLGLVGAEDDIRKPFGTIVLQVFTQKLEIAVEHSLGDYFAAYRHCIREERALGKFQHPVPGETRPVSVLVQKEFFGPLVFERTIL